MKDGYVNEGQEPFVLPENTVNKETHIKQEARKANRKHYGLVGLKIQTSSPCRHCGRKSCNTREECKRKAEQKLASRAVMVDKYVYERKQ